MSRRLDKLFVVIVMFCCAEITVFAQGAAKPLGMILDVQGTVNIQRGRANDKAMPADSLFAGDQISTSANATVIFSFCPQGQRLSLRADSTVLVSDTAVQQSKGAAASRTTARCTLPQVALGKRDIDHIGAMSARGAPPIPLYLGGIISTTRPRFMWAPVAAALEYKLTVGPPGEKALWTWNHTGAASEVQIPETDTELRPGNYTWELTALANGKLVAQQSAMFEVKPNPELSSLRAGGTPQLEVAAAFENAGYYAEAAAIYRNLRSQSDDPRITRQLLWLYAEIGLFAASNDELPKAKAGK